MWLNLLFLLTVIALAMAVWAWRNFAPWVPTRKNDFPRILDLANLQSSETFYELGCGDGRVAEYISQYSPARVVGIEISWPFFLMAKIRAYKKTNLKILFKNLYQLDLGQANVVYLFGTPQHSTKRMTNMLRANLKSGSRIITYAFPLAGWQPTKISKPSDQDLAIYLYQI